MRCLPSLLAATLLLAGAQPSFAQGGLADFRLVGEPIAIKGVEEDASGVTVSEKTGLRYVVLNGDTSILELSPAGTTTRTITLQGFEDTEDILWIKGTTFAVVEERRRNLCFFDIPADATTVSYNDAIKHRVDKVPAKNLGIEGVAYDPASDRYFIVKEKQPRRLYAVQVKADASPVVTTPWDIEKQALGMTDLSGVFFDRQTGHLLVLSDESRCVVECTVEGQEVARLSLTAGSAGLAQDIPQPEGITIDPQGRLLICSEPNLLYVFERPKAD